MKYAVCTQRKCSIESLSFAISWHQLTFPSCVLNPCCCTADFIYTILHLHRNTQVTTNKWSKNMFSKELHRLLQWNIPDFSLVLQHSSTLVNDELDCCREQVQGRFQMYKVEILRVSRGNREVRVTERWHWLPGRLWSLILENSSKAFWTWSWATSLDVPAWAGGLDKVTSRGAFKPQPFCDCEIVPMEDYCEL